MRALLIDDQEDVVYGLKQGIHWSGLGFSDVECVCSTDSARDILLRHTVDLIISDIEMPKESGLQLMEWVRRQGNKVPCIFLTAYPEFRYAQEAVRLGGFDYLLQPVDYHELEKVIQKAMERTADDQGMINHQAQVEKLWFDVMMGITPSNDAAFMQHLVRSGSSDRHYFSLCHIHIIRRRYTIDELSQHDFSTNFKSWLCEYMGSSKAEIITTIPSHYFAITSSNEPESLSLTRSRWSKAYAIAEAERCGIACYIGESCRLNQIEKTAMALLDLDKSNTSGTCGVFTLSGSQENPAQCGGNEDDGIIRQVQDRISETLHQSITREELAQAVHISPQYLSRLFKKHIGKPLQEYIQDERIFKAKKMLQFNCSAISAIAEECGFSSATYFSYVFKQHTGMTPAEYRAQDKADF